MAREKIEVVIEGVAREYEIFKELFDREVKKAESLREKFLNIKDTDGLLEDYYDTFGKLDLMHIDLNQIKIKLYHYVTLSKELGAEPPEHILKLVSDYTPSYIFSKDGDIVNKSLYDNYKDNYLKSTKELLQLKNNK